MKKMLHTAVLLLGIVFSSCETKYEEPDTAIDAGRQFISAIYNGNFKRAGQLVLDNNENHNFLAENIEKDFRSRDAFGKEALSKESIRIVEIKTLDSATTLLTFTNAYTKKQSVLAIKKEGDMWRVDLTNGF